jgi:hypothetical protein
VVKDVVNENSPIPPEIVSAASMWQLKSPVDFLHAVVLGKCYAFNICL